MYIFYLLVPQLLLAGVLVADQGAVVIAAVLLLDVVFHLIPWRIPRASWRASAYWSECMLYNAPFVLLVIYGAGTASVLFVLPNPAWFGLSAIIAAGLVASSRINVRALISGDLAFVAGPDVPAHAFARATVAGTAPLGEEYVFRGVPILVSGQPAAAVLGAVAFVCRHHAVRGWTRVSRHQVVTESVAAVSLGLLTLFAHSIWPALVAHQLANLPGLVLDVQRGRAHQPSHALGGEEMS